jgi:hypothetical protein
MIVRLVPKPAQAELVEALPFFGEHCEKEGQPFDKRRADGIEVVVWKRQTVR